MPDNDMTLGRYLESARKEAGLSLRQVSELADVQLTIVARLMSDKMQSPKPAQLIRIAQVLEVSASDLFLLAGIPMPTDLPTVEALLRAEYDLPEEAVSEARQQIEAIVARYKASSSKRKGGNNGTN